MKDLLNVLIIDDNDQFAEAITDLLKDDGYTVKFAASLAGASSLIEKHEIDAIICDLNLPDGKGTDLLFNLRKTGSPIPVIIISGSISTEVLNQCMILGAFDVFEKPVKIPFLFRSLNFAIMMGIQYRNLFSKLSEKLSEEDLKQINSYFKMIAKTRGMNLDDKLKN